MPSNYHPGTENDPRAPWNIPADDRPSCHHCEDRPRTSDDGLCNPCREMDYEEPETMGEAIERLISRADLVRKERRE